MRVPNPSLDRRRLLRTGGLAVSAGIVVAACGADRGGLDAPGRLGVADQPRELPDVEVNDVVLLRTAQSLEYTALAVYDAALATGGLTADETALVGRFVEDHQRHADDIGALIAANGGEEYPCPNTFMMDRQVGPILAALDGTDDLNRDLLNIAHAFETIAAQSYQALVVAIEDLSIRRAAMTIGGEENRHAAALAAAINPTELVSPAVFGEPTAADAEGFPIPYAIPAVVGQLDGVELIVGAPDDEGTRFAVNLQTPAPNSLVYEGESC